MILAISLLRIGAHRDRHGLGRYQLVGEARQYALLIVATTDGTTIVADPLAEMTKTAVAIVDDDAILAAAASAGKQA
jgi:hypothetical protein